MAQAACIIKTALRQHATGISKQQAAAKALDVTCKL
jgi:hypothetical protein